MTFTYIKHTHLNTAYENYTDAELDNVESKHLRA